ncbi:hypothetical protein BGZ89_008415 [Linnemannia elongata]|nr:hypothetical protein BGZ89_008415 [Linnemannia elongata]
MEDIWVNLPPKIIHKLYKALPGKMQQLIRTRGYRSMRKEDDTTTPFNDATTPANGGPEDLTYEDIFGTDDEVDEYCLSYDNGLFIPEECI